MFAVPTLVIAILNKKGYIPKNIGNVLIAIVMAVGIIVVFRKYWDISSRSNMVFDEYKWAWDPNANKPTVLQYDIDQIKGSSNSLENELNSFSKDLDWVVLDRTAVTKALSMMKRNKSAKL